VEYKTKEQIELSSRLLGYNVKHYFLSFYAINNDLAVDLASGATTIYNDGNPPTWKVHLVDSGLHIQTSGRLKRLQKWLDKDEVFFFTYGDSVADLDLGALLEFHHRHGKLEPRNLCCQMEKPVVLRRNRSLD